MEKTIIKQIISALLLKTITNYNCNHIYILKLERSLRANKRDTINYRSFVFIAFPKEFSKRSGRMFLMEKNYLQRQCEKKQKQKQGYRKIMFYQVTLCGNIYVTPDVLKTSKSFLDLPSDKMQHKKWVLQSTIINNFVIMWTNVRVKRKTTS